MSILTKYQSDMDQILSNFIPYNNPYIILSWKVPLGLSSTGFAIPQEIRSEVLWNGNVNLTYPTDISAMEKYKITGDTSFTIKGWLFPANQNPVSNIYYIKENFINERLITSVTQLTGTTFNNTIYPAMTAGTVIDPAIMTNVKTITANGYPQITNNTTYITQSSPDGDVYL